MLEPDLLSQQHPLSDPLMPWAVSYVSSDSCLSAPLLVAGNRLRPQVSMTHGCLSQGFCFGVCHDLTTLVRGSSDELKPCLTEFFKVRAIVVCGHQGVICFADAGVDKVKGKVGGSIHRDTNAGALNGNIVPE
ncbi:hypothetical protein N7471_009106 [Penicillium samsonianum]|uniref:uncharacterized protein n=1 Tax=Penicillium samsonianum TaxID=1882272 RepID=UPI0025491622|nr:uncharacterized protein N7471_009106 [Penicillium samsonianum]KAJ6127889.1 hypothetical protein N7471_009106 [Penicillium samsonianum]